jgi:hypothetical protein
VFCILCIILSAIQLHQAQQTQSKLLSSSSVCGLHPVHHLLHVELQLSCSLHLKHDVAAAQQLTLNIHLQRTATAAAAAAVLAHTGATAANRKQQHSVAAVQYLTLHIQLQQQPQQQQSSCSAAHVSVG